MVDVVCLQITALNLCEREVAMFRDMGYHEEGRSSFLRKVGKQLPVYTVSYFTIL